MRQNLWSQKIPTLLGLGIIIFGIAATTYLVDTGTLSIGQAAPGELPKNVRITSISDTSFTVSYVTDKETTGTVTYGKDDSLGSIALDQRDQDANNLSSHKVHSITVQNLQPESKYFFAIISGEDRYIQDGSAFQITTGPTISTLPSDLPPVTGSVLTPEGSAPKEAIVYITSQGAQTISALLRPDGTYSLPINQLRAEDLSTYFSLPSDQILKMLVQNSTLKSSVMVLPSQAPPVPSIILSKDYDFTVSSSPLDTLIGEYGFPTLYATTSADHTPSITSPKKDEVFKDQKPLFKGIASPGATVRITIESEEKIENQVTASSNGSWSFRPSQPLLPGTHTITITAPDPFGVLRTIKQTFTVYAQGSRVGESATPSATPTLTATPQPTQEPTPTFIPSPTPTFIPTLSPTPTVVFIQPTLSAPPGSPLSTIGIAGAATTVIGIILFFFSKGKIPLP